MTSRFIRGYRAKGLRAGDDQIVTTQWLDDGNGTVHEHVTLETPKALTDTQRLRLVATWENQKEFPA
jgi:hypothetical protein